MPTDTAPAPAPSAPPGALVNAAPPGNPSVPFQYPDNADEPSGQEAFDNMFSTAPDKSKEAEDKPAPSAPAPDQKPGKTSIDDGLPAEKAPEKAPEAPAPAQKEPKSAPELREAYKRANETLAAKEKELAELRTKLSAPAPKPELNGEAETYQKRISDLETRLKEREEILKFTDYSQSSEYKETYLAPLEKAVETAKKKLLSYTVDQEDGTKRRTSVSDLKPLLSMEDGEAWEKAEQIWGTKAPAIMALRDNIVELNQRAQNAIEEYKTKGSEQLKIKEQQMSEAQAREIEGRIKSFESHISSRQTTHAALYGPDEKDVEGNKLLEQGRKLVDVAFKGAADMAPEDLIKVQAEVAARASAFGRAVHRTRQLESKVAELTKKLEAYEKSEPARGSRDAGDAQQPDDGRPTWMADLDRIPSMRGR